MVDCSILTQKVLLQMEFNFWKCETENFDSCEKFLKGYRVADVCPFLSKKNQFWSTFLEKIEPQITCPVKPVSNLKLKSF